MSTNVETEQELKEKAFEMLNLDLPPHKVARLLSNGQIGKGDYIKDRDALFVSEWLERKRHN